MNSDDFDRIVKVQLDACRATLAHKASEYATHDRLHNFRVAAYLQNVSYRQSLSGMMAKHIVSLYDMCQSEADYPIELWTEKITDSINYLLLLKALVSEETDAVLDTEEIDFLKAALQKNEQPEGTPLPAWINKHKNS